MNMTLFSSMYPPRIEKKCTECIAKRMVCSYHPTMGQFAEELSPWLLKIWVCTDQRPTVFMPAELKP